MSATWKGRPVKPGTIGFTRIGGVLGFFIGLGQFVLGDGSRYSHVFVVVHDDLVVEAMPSGARLAPLSQYLDGRELAFGTPIPLDAEQRNAIVEEALRLIGTKYGFSTYLSLALSRWGIRPKVLRNYIEKSGRLICSALADCAYTRAGIQLFDDGRWHHDVTPGDLANCFIERDWSKD